MPDNQKDQTSGNEIDSLLDNLFQETGLAQLLDEYDALLEGGSSGGGALADKQPEEDPALTAEPLVEEKENRPEHVPAPEPAPKPEPKQPDPLDDLFNFATPAPGQTPAPAAKAPLDDLFDFDVPAPKPAPAAAQPPKKQAKKKNGWKKLADTFVPGKGDDGREVVRKSILSLSVVVMIVCLGIIANQYLIEPWRAKRFETTLSDPHAGTPEAVDIQSIIAAHPDVAFPEGLLPEAYNFYAQNQDYAGTISIPGIDLGPMPVVQGKDNDYYLNVNFNKNKTHYGAPFVDFRNPLKNLSFNTILYGHNMKRDDLIFGKLEEYLSLDGYQKAPVIAFNTLYFRHQWKIFAVFVTNSNPSHDNGYLFDYISTNITDNQARFEGYKQQLEQRRLYDTGVDLTMSDRVLTLSTCIYPFDDARLVVVARMVREGESPSVNAAAARANPSPRYPQIWYDTHKEKNPFKNAEKW
jgi:sortase B